MYLHEYVAGKTYAIALFMYVWVCCSHGNESFTGVKPGSSDTNIIMGFKNWSLVIYLEALTVSP